MSYEKLGMQNFSNLNFIEETYKRYMADPNSVDISFRHFFEGIDFAALMYKQMPAAVSDDLRISHLIEAYRYFGHLIAKFNPLYTVDLPLPLELKLEHLGFKNEELEKAFPTCNFIKEKTAPLKTIIEALRRTYSAKIGLEYMGLGNLKLEEWIQKRVEPYFDLHLTPEAKLEIFDHLSKAEVFELFLHTKYVGQKRFSLEGAETLIPMISAILENSGAKEVVMGMAHRGRLNVLVNILNKSYAHVFHEFEDFYSPETYEGTGDVKYHKGFEGKFKDIMVTLCANPSHLESVDPVALGQARAKIEKMGKNLIIPLLIHGDAAIAGQGVVYETMQLGNLNGYSTGGTVHIIVNNQIGFTTLPKDTRSTRYCTDIAKSFGAPVFHVDAEDPESCIAAAIMAVQIRQEFNCDVFIDLYCYRKYGHNEGDEPTFTQPLEYKIIREKKSILSIYQDLLVKEGVLSAEGAKNLDKEFRKTLDSALDAVKTKTEFPLPKKLEKEDPFKKIETKVAAEKLLAQATKYCEVDKEFHIHPKIEKLLQERLSMVKEDSGIDWGMGETLAYASLVDEGKDVRISGQDCRRGTFSHRQAMWVDTLNENKYFPLSHIRKNQGLFDIFNSPLSEYAVLGFDYGYSIEHSDALVIWEAQFGDFCNGAQIIIDQYIAPSEQKWGQRSPLTLLLPHGYEGQGPEHSSARMERFLQLCGDENMRIANCSTPAQLFHLLRRQTLNPIKKPLVIFTPKAMLRHPLCKSKLKEFTQGEFQTIIDDPLTPEKVARVLLTSGKMYYELSQEREKLKRFDIALLRIELLYPLDIDKLQEFLNKYRGAEIFWVQEEHKNMGAWTHINEMLEGKVKLNYAGRTISASPAAGSHALHKLQLNALLKTVFS